MVTDLHIIVDKGNNIFTGERYIVPLYQRGYAWEEKHIVQLIDDVMDVEDNRHYYIGSLIVHRRDDGFEVIDGQQRLTTLFLLLMCLGEIQGSELTALRFDCRAKSNYTLEHINEITSETTTVSIDKNNIQNDIISGYNIICDKLRSIDETALRDRLRNTILYRIEVPKHTDLNHYFEIMNTRGEQLEPSDLLKARLMAHLQGDKKWQGIFSAIWDACRDMNGYVQMHLSKTIREELFGTYWNNLPSERIKDYTKLPITDKQAKGYSINDAIKNDFKIKHPDNTYTEESQRARFESIIDFPYFLLHTLRVFVHSKDISSHTELLDTMLDDKKLVDAFNRVICKGTIRQKPVNKTNFVKDFIICLLRTRFLFDRYIIKREFIGDTAQDGEWALKDICSSGQGSNKKAMYRLTKVVADGCWHNDERNKEVLMLQSAMRVSYTSPKVMHWITDLLIWLTDCFTGKGNGWIYEDVVDDIAKEPVAEFLKDERNLYLGVATPHIVLNYLDYLLWKNDKNADFDFEFRNSVEHWYPRNPSEGSFARWEDDGPKGVNRFGNLCLIQRNVNSKFSNMHPSAKKSTFQEMIGKGSLKLRKMSETTTDDSLLWRDITCAQHEQEMLSLLREACASTMGIS